MLRRAFKILRLPGGTTSSSLSLNICTPCFLFLDRAGTGSAGTGSAGTGGAGTACAHASLIIQLHPAPQDQFGHAQTQTIQQHDGFAAADAVAVGHMQWCKNH